MTDNNTVVLSPGGKKLSENGKPAEAMAAALQTWRALPEPERKPKALPDLGYPDPPAPPRNGLILRANSRALLRDAAGKLRRPERMLMGDGSYGWPAEPQVDYVWLTESEWKSLVPPDLFKGAKHPVPSALVERIATFHLLDKGLATPEFFWADAKGEMTLTVEDASAGSAKLGLEGSAVLGPGSGYPVRFRGQLAYDGKKKAFTKFDVVALGRDDGDQRPPDKRVTQRGIRYELPHGCVPLLAASFERVEGTTALERVPPYALLYDSEKNYNRPYFPRGK